MRLFGSLFSLPYMIFFYVSWIVFSLVQPWAAVTLICVLTHPTASYRKWILFVTSMQYLVFCRDKSWKKPLTDPAAPFQESTTDNNNNNGSTSSDATIRKKTIIFVRHGESTWNDTFNKGDRSKGNFLLYFVPNLIKAIAMEWYFWVAGRAHDSWFFDAPLSSKGLEQANGIHDFLLSQQHQSVSGLTPREAEWMQYLLPNSDKNESVLWVSSNLRRAIATLAIGFQDQFLSKTSSNSSIVILPQLQEISRNPDALCITPAYSQTIFPAWTDPLVLRRIYNQQTKEGSTVKHCVDTSQHYGNKAVTSNGLERMQDFCRFVFEQDKNNIEAIVAAGHSLWFRSFFQTFLPWTVDHVAKKKKLINGGIVGFTLIQKTQQQQSDKTGNDGETVHYMIDPASIVVLHGGF